MGAVAVFLCFENIHADPDHTCSNHKASFSDVQDLKVTGLGKE